MPKTLIYLATPYSHPEESVMAARFDAVNKKASEFMREGHHIFSPISHTHPIALAGELPRGWEFWQAYDRAIMAACCEVWVLMLDGWRESVGVGAEIDIAGHMGIPVRYIAADNED